MNIILASKSPRRSEILKNLEINFTVVTAETDESSDEKTPEVLVEELAKRKAIAVKELLCAQNRLTADTVIIAADTVVSKDNKILGKPKNKDDATYMLKLLSGEKHDVISGVAVIYSEETVTSHEVTHVFFDRLSQKEISDYIDTGECNDKAGAYGIQGLASKFINRIDGCYFNVVGLPVNLLYRITKQLGISVF